MMMLEKLTQVLGDEQWHSTPELVEQVGHRFSATLHRASFTFSILSCEF